MGSDGEDHPKIGPTQDTRESGVKGVASPCTKKCRLNDWGICEQCFRTLEEITLWQEAGDRERRRILSAARNRREGATKKLRCR